ncbi:MAG TPA: RnfABCDGE type electron transport complex subunit D [Candidatus Binataceae bacterium]|jgi:Na+-transporting NADH:ubiquinone oxidoreductase subunit NqrB|nr:RnfABCDGE type electron transport complex subunit D [Candidatus Binataceae bacterium]
MDTNTWIPRIGSLLPTSCADPRLAQILFLGLLLAAGAYLRDFSIHPAQIALTFACGLCCQNVCERLARRPSHSLRSAIITSFSVTLLLRASTWWIHPIAVIAAIASKFILRLRGKHLFNPANFGVLFALALLPGTWISAGQWGQDVALAGWMIGMGSIVTRQARRADISWTFLGFYVSALAIRVMWLGQRFAVLTHQLSSGALLLFAFFMISDPMTIPNDRRGRAAHAALVSAIAYLWQFYFYRTNGLLWALLLAAPAVALWDALWPAPGFQWNTKGESSEANLEVVAHPALGNRPGWASDSAFGSARVLRLLRRQKRHLALQPRLAGRDGA